MPRRSVIPACSLHVETDGSGPPLLLLPGFACHREAWGVAVVRALAEHFFVLRPDWPGTGYSPPVPDALAITALAETVREVLDVHAVPRTSLFGWGLGALVALQLTVEHPGRVERLVLAGGAAYGAPLLDRAPTVAALCGVAHNASAEEHMLGLVHRLVSPRWRPFAELFLPQLLPRPIATLAELRRQWAALSNYDLRPRLGEIRTPTLVLTGAEDSLTPPDQAEHLQAGIAGARLQVIGAAGHAVMWEQPALVLEAVVPFLEYSTTGEEFTTEKQRTCMQGSRPTRPRLQSPWDVQ